MTAKSLLKNSSFVAVLVAAYVIIFTIEAAKRGM